MVKYIIARAANCQTKNTTTHYDTCQAVIYSDLKCYFIENVCCEICYAQMSNIKKNLQCLKYLCVCTTTLYICLEYAKTVPQLFTYAQVMLMQ